jgi:hypothetical protein
MKGFPIFACITFCSFCAFSQAQFEQGYFVKSNGVRVDCLIRNSDKINNPTAIEYRLPGFDEIRAATIEEINEFGIANTPERYQRFEVSVDKSSSDRKNLSRTASPSFQQKVVFLRVLLEGKASLYAYFSNGTGKFFFRIEGEDFPPQPLVYKEYLYDGTLRENVSFRQELWNKLKCEELTHDYFLRTPYTEKALVRVFSRYNGCIGAQTKIYSSTGQKGSFGLSIRAGINVASLRLEQKKIFNYTNIFPASISPLISVEAEYPFLSNHKWSIIFAPAYQRFMTSGEATLYNGNQVPSNPNGFGAERTSLGIDYSLITAPLGIRRYVYLTANSTFFLNAALAWNFILNEDNAFDPSAFYQDPAFDQDLKGINPAVALGAGYRFKGTLGVEIAYDINRTTMDNANWRTSFVNSWSLVLTYKFY